MTGKMVKIRNFIIMGVITMIVLGSVTIANLQTKKVTKETVNKEMETMQSSINDDVMSGVIDYLQKVLPDAETAGLSGEAYNKILETVDKSMQESLQEKLNETLTNEDISALENDITAIVRQCVSDMSIDGSQPVKGVDYFTDSEVEAMSKTVSTIVESNIQKKLSDDTEKNATSLSVVKSTIDSNINNLKNSYKTCQDDINSLKSKVDGVSSSGISDLKTKYENLNSSLSTYKTSSEAAIKSAGENATVAKNTAATANDNATAAKTAADNANNTLSSLQSEVEDTKSKLNSKVEMKLSTKIDEESGNSINVLTFTTGTSEE